MNLTASTQNKSNHRRSVPDIDIKNDQVHNAYEAQTHMEQGSPYFRDSGQKEKQSKQTKNT